MAHGIILYKYMPLEAFEKTIKNWSLKATYPVNTNDPLEFVPRNSEHEDFVEIMRRNIYTLPYFHSFSTKVTDVAMWGRYADSSRGVCLAFCFPTNEEVNVSEDDEEYRKYDTPQCGKLLKVKYETQRVPLNLKDNPGIEELLTIIATKAKCWSSECEFRFIDTLNNADEISEGNAFYKKYMNHLCGVVVGERCRYSVEYIMKWFKVLRNQKDEDDKIYTGEVLLSDDGSGAQKKLMYPIVFAQACVHDEKFEILNGKFIDNMTIERYREKERSATIVVCSSHTA